MSERRKYDVDFRDRAVTIVRETARPIAEVARDLGVGAGTLGNWVHKDRMVRGDGPDRTRVDAAYVRQLERELAEVRVERDVLTRSVVLLVKEATRWHPIVAVLGQPRPSPFSGSARPGGGCGCGFRRCAPWRLCPAICRSS
jgi:transposase